MPLPESTVHPLLPKDHHGPTGHLKHEASDEEHAVASMARFLRNQPLHCSLTLATLDTGIRTVLAGLGMLDRSGQVRSRLHLRRPDPDDQSAPWHLRNKKSSQSTLRVGSRTALIDVHDSWEFDPEGLASHDVYFKRSFDPDRMLGSTSARVRPLGLLSDVRPEGFDRLELRSLLSHPDGFRASAGSALRLLGGSALSALGLGHRPTHRRMHAAPIRSQAPRVLFMARLWDPDEIPLSAPGKRAERELINSTRAKLVRALRREFGERFTGGVSHSDFAHRRYPDVLLPDPQSARQMHFMALARQHPVCVTSMGLHESTGFKMAEFIALSRAVVTEPLRHAVPGNLAPGTHYLEFETPDQCVERVSRLMDHPAEREEMMDRNWDYYQRWLRPDRLVWRMIALTLAA